MHSSAATSTSWLDEQVGATGGFPLTHFSQNRWLGYPHCNAFTADGRYVILGSTGEKTSEVWRLDLRTGEEKEICEFPRDGKMGYYDVAAQAAVVVVATDRALWLYDLETCSLISTHHPKLGDGYRVDDLPSITADGREVVVGFSREGRWGGYLWEVAGDKAGVLFEKPWHANHFHFCPHDKNWIAFSHEGPANQIPDRMWAWHSTLAPEGKCVFDQRAGGEGTCLQVGHERWNFHEASAVFVAYGGNPVASRGVFEAYAHGQPGRQVYKGSALHVNTSPDGRWMVIDTLGPYDVDEWTEGPPPGPWPWGLLSDIVVLDRHTGAHEFVAHSLMGNRHPAHPHPAFSFDGRYIFYNEAERDADLKRCRVVAARNPLWRDK